MMLASVSTALLRQPALAMCRCQTNHANRELLVKRSPSFITTLTLNRPKANAMGAVLMSQFNEALKELEDDNDATRCVIIKSSLPKVFCAGADLKERRGMTLEQAEATVDGLRESLQRLACLPMPTLAVVEGVAVGGGLELALATDIIISSHAASFGLPETSLGIIPGAGGTQRLPRRIGAARALEWIATGQRIDSITAHDYGLVQYVEDDAYAKAVEIAQKIAKNAPIAVRAAKEAVLQGLEAPTMEDALHTERQGYARTLVTQDRLEGLAAFSEGRLPEYKGQ